MAASRKLLLAALLAPALCAGAQQPPPAAQLTVDPAHIVAPVSPTLYGMMTEEINHAFDGGLYAELLQNRTFRSDWEGVENWQLVRLGNATATLAVDKADGPSAALPTSLAVSATQASPGNEAGVANSGFWGIAVRPHTEYRGSLYAKPGAQGPAQTLEAQLVSDKTGAVLASASIALQGTAWAQYHFVLRTSGPEPSAANHFRLLLASPGTVKLQEVSLFPPTFANRPNGNRADLMQLMAGLHPHFLRLPGGNYLEGDTLADWYDWKKTIGPLADRPGHQAPWSYWSSDGLGLLEFLEWCEDLHMEPVLAVYAGYALKGEHVEPGQALAPYVQAALDEVEYVTGGPGTRWGAERAKDGHPAPFPLHFIEIGNEDQFDKSGSYPARFAQFAQALRAKYPQYKLIATTPLGAAGGATAAPDLIDDHYYKSPAEMFDMAHQYDSYPRSGAPKVFVGEWATRSGTPTPNFGDALGDAAWMTGMERNADVIMMASYAPLFVNVSPGAMQWATDLIGYDALSSYGSPSYYAQSLFAGHLGEGTAQSTLAGAGPRFFYSATVSPSAHMLHLKLVNASTADQPLAITLPGLAGPKRATAYRLHAASYEATNTLSMPQAIHPVTSTLPVTGFPWNHPVPALTIEVVDIPLD